MHKLKKKQNKNIENIEKYIKELDDTQINLTRKLNKVTQFHQSLSKRIFNILRILKKPNLSQEKKIQDELKQSNEYVSSLENKMKEVFFFKKKLKFF